MTAPCTYPDNDTPTPHLVIEREDMIHGLGNNDTTIVRINHESKLPDDGLLPDTLITNTPHAKAPKETRIDDTRVRYIPLANAPKWYRDRITTDLNTVRWVGQANKYYQHSDAGEMKAIVMAIGEHTDVIGAGQSAVISDVTGWSEKLVNTVLSDLQTTKYDAYRRDATTTSTEALR
ncbi:hypothetical protein [Natronoglomus mannanivorans]|uniref:Uncharacterized protein n=1 Tax=Natronoglomus mannanivorans TaxID=2979990 RepID=A0AAP2Z360_9EURY|nr:hypothetical protein [Halobacteria archaeon AArc-xg1-1]